MKKTILSLLLLALPLGAAEPIKALLITGGCCHDYAKQKLIISQGISKPCERGLDNYA